MVERKLHPGAKWLFRFTGFFSGIFFAFFFSMFIGGLVAAIIVTNPSRIFGLLSILPIFLVFLIIWVEVYARLSYKYWKYEFLEDQLRIERGIIWKRYSNIPYQRMQNIDITRGVIARIFGFSSVNIQTAGYSMQANARGMISEGYIPAVSIQDAEKIREFVIKKITRKKGQGL
jgi:membrane protein YdbS with pleckstrin-like domain